MEINYILTEDDYLNFNLFHTKHSKVVKKSLLIQRLMGPVIFIAFSYLFSIFADLPFIGLFVTFSIISVLWYIFYPAYFYKLIIRNVKKAMNEGDNGGLLGKRQMILNEEGIIDVNSSSKTESNWQAIKDIKEDENNFFLYNSAVSAYIIPKRDLKQIDELRSYLLENINK